MSEKVKKWQNQRLKTEMQYVNLKRFFRLFSAMIHVIEQKSVKYESSFEMVKRKEEQCFKTYKMFTKTLHYQKTDNDCNENSYLHQQFHNWRLLFFLLEPV